MQVDVRQQRGDNAASNVANFPVEFAAVVSRERLRPRYGDGFAGAPLTIWSFPTASCGDEPGGERARVQFQTTSGGTRDV